MKAFIKRLDITFERMITRAFAAWCLLNLVIMCVITEPDRLDFTRLAFAQDIGIVSYILFFFSAFILLMALDALIKTVDTDAWILLLSMLGMAFFTVSVMSSAGNAYTKYFYVFFILVVIAAVLYYLTARGRLRLPIAFYGKKLFIKAENRKKAAGIAGWAFAALLGGIFLYIVGTIGVLRYKTFSSPNFDFGIFVNMFHNMRETLLPMVTCERDGLLSHFAVHISPIYYLLLPFYILFPTPETLQIGQAAILASGVIPVYLICRKYNLKKLWGVLLCAVYVFLPALSGGTFYDIHENCFLTPLLLWTFYFFEKEKPVPMYIFAALTLAVKEDAAIYIAFFGLYALIVRHGKKRVHGAVCFVAACAWFLTAVTLLNNFGDGAMSGRYANYIYNDQGFFGMIKTCIYNPSYVFTQLAVTGKDNITLINKLLYILQMLVPLAFIPFISKKISRYVLVFPMVLMNLMTLYQYQYDIGFQYNFGVTAFLMWLTIMNIADMKPVGKRFAVSFCAIAAALMFSVFCMPKYNYYVSAWEDGREYYEQIDEILDTIDPDASLTISTFLLPHVADRSEIYEIYYHDIKREDRVLTDYVVVDARYGGREDINKYLALGCYETEEEYPGLITILKKNGEPRPVVPNTDIDEPEE